MVQCPECAAALPDTAKFCPACGAPRAAGERAPSRTFEATRTLQDDSSLRPSSSSIHGRFEPGTRLGTRYRIVGLLGRGGMGEVYRADDLELNQSVALKFLPERMAAQPVELERLRKEVRIAREISHPNVCRTYDIAEAAGHYFLVMEYIDGEDLSSVLRRMGRPTHDKAVEIARQLALGLAAAHENGVLHRDLKPANVMIDGRGRVRITDFGLAGLAEEFAKDPQNAGTPAYMAPEQLHGSAATVASDIYALGLTLYEVFTGKRAGDQRKPGPSGDSSVTTPSTFAPEIDPAVERLLLQCMEEDPRLRPQSAYAVLGALPGGDPLAAALAAGETPSPELVASTGGEGSVRPLTAVIWLVVALAGLIGSVALMGQRFSLLDDSAAALALKARGVLEAAGFEKPPAHSAAGFMTDRAINGYYASRDSAGFDTSPSPKDYPSRQLYYSRWSTKYIRPDAIHLPQAWFEHPDYAAGQVFVVLDGSGRLMGFRRFPQDRPSGKPVPDWTPFLRLAGYDPSALTRVFPHSSSQIPGIDSTAVWRGQSLDDSTEVTLTVAGSGGRPMRFWVSGTWGSTRDLGSPAEDDSRISWFQLLVFTVLPMVAAVVLARHNIHLGRGDRKGATRLAVAIFLAYMINHLLSLHFLEIGVRRTLLLLLNEFPIGHSLLHAVFIWMSYVAIEPYIRKLWPRSLVSWMRLSSGRFRDPIVGRDILLGGLVAGVVHVCASTVMSLAMRAGKAPQFLATDNLGKALLGVDMTLGVASETAAVCVLMMLVFFTLLLVSRLILRRNILAAAALFLLLGLGITFGSGVPAVPYGLAFGLILASGMTLVIVRFGFVSTLVFLLVTRLLLQLPFTVNFNAWYSSVALVGPALLTALFLYAFSTALGGQSLFKDILGDSK